MTRAALWVLLILPILTAVLVVLSPFTTDPASLWSGLAIGSRPGWLRGIGTIDPAAGLISYPLGAHAAHDLLALSLPLWNHDEGLGTPLLGEMQSAALFPPTMLLAFPHGTLLEHGLLQILAGLGTYLFLRKFGLGVVAAVTGGVLFEFNGVFAWLTNAIFNPVAFLPWLFYAIESRFVGARFGELVTRRMASVCLGALAAAMALYAGFPEEVYLYSLLLAVWAISRALLLTRRQALTFICDLFSVAALTLVLSAPLLIAFGSFLQEAAVGGHQGDGFPPVTPLGLLAYVLPYIYGAIFAAPPGLVGNEFWFNIGGYLGAMPILLGTAGVAANWRRQATWVLVAWMVIAIGASHGMPGVHAVFLTLPLVKITLYGRYLNASWVFAGVVLSAMFIDRLPTLTPAARIRIGWIGCCCLLLALAGALIPAWPILNALWETRHGQRAYILASFGTALGLVAAFQIALRLPTGAVPQVLGALAATEALLAFLLPFACFPQISGIDRPLIDFLHRNTGLQRVAVAATSGLMPNYGALFGFPLLNYDDLPVPARTAELVRTRLDPEGNPLLFRPDGRIETRIELDRSRRMMLDRLPSYRAVGVRYLLAPTDFFSQPAFAHVGTGAVAVPLAAGQSLTLPLDRGPSAPLRGIMLTIGTYGGKSDGDLHAHLCLGETCVDGTAALSQALDNHPLPIMFNAPIAMSGSGPVLLTLTKQGGEHDVALWSLPAETPSTEATRLLPILSFADATDPLPVMQSTTATVFEVTPFRPYVAAEGCRIQTRSQDVMQADCDRPSRLVRLEVFMRGWEARVNGAAAPVVPVENLFQGVDLPTGQSVVTFSYAPYGLRPAFVLALATLFGTLAIIGWSAIADSRHLDAKMI